MLAEVGLTWIGESENHRDGSKKEEELFHEVGNESLTYAFTM
jgi:hypothetical protein